MLKFYDNSVTIKEEDGKSEVNLRKISDSQYFFTKPGSGKGHELFLKTTFVFITSIELIMKRSALDEPNKIKTVKFTAKRF